MPIVTQSRPYFNKGQVLSASHYRAGKLSDVTVAHYGFTGQTETTTSYRSGPEYDDPAEFSSRSGSRDDFQREIYAEHRYRYDNGHEFSTEKTWTEISHPNGAYLRNSPVFGVEDEYRGFIYPNQGLIARLPTVVFPTTNQINADGRKLIQSAAPTRPEVSLATFLGELAEGLPSLIGYRAYREGVGSRNLGSEYLNYEFGVKPVINDVRNLAAAVLAFNERWEQFKKDNGLMVRRRRTLLEEQVATTPVSGSFSPGMARRLGVDVTSNYFAAQSAPYSRYHDVVRRKVWFAGAFTYYLAEAEDALGRMEAFAQKANLLLGSTITAETIYELTPWSWLLDWFTDMGTLVSNVTRFSSDNLVLRYGYVMHHTEAYRERYTSGWVPKVYTGRPPGRVEPVFYRRDYISRKTRTRSTPYGFGLNASAFSPRQWAILGALGMTKAPEILR